MTCKLPVTNLILATSKHLLYILVTVHNFESLGPLISLISHHLQWMVNIYTWAVMSMPTAHWQTARCTSEHTAPPSVLQHETLKNSPSHSFSEYLHWAWMSLSHIVGSIIPWGGLTWERSGNTCLCESRGYLNAQCHHWVTSGHMPGNVSVENSDVCRDENLSTDQQGSRAFYCIPEDKKQKVSKKQVELNFCQTALSCNCSSL